MTAALITVAPMVGKLLRLLGSDKDGEIVASVHALRRVLAGVGLSLHDLAEAIEPRARTSQHDDDSDEWRAMANDCARHAYALTEREFRFVLTMARWRGTPSRKQCDWLEAIYDRVREAAA